MSSARGAAFGDLFNDRKIDVVINNIDGPPILLRNVLHNRSNWVELKLVGGARSPRDAVGAKAYLSANGITQRADVISGGSYCSSNDFRVHFGIANATRVDRLLIQWPSGENEIVHLPSVSRIFALEEGKGIVDDSYP